MLNSKVYAVKNLTVTADHLGKEGDVLVTSEERTRRQVLARIPQGACLGTVVRMKGRTMWLVEGDFGSLWVHENHRVAGTKYNQDRKTVVAVEVKEEAESLEARAEREYGPSSK